MNRLANRIRTMGRLLAYFCHRERFFLLPILLLLLLGGILMAMSSGAGAVAPLWYAIF